MTDELVRTIALAGPAAEVSRALDDYAELADWVLLCPPIGLPAAVERTQAGRIVEAFRNFPVAEAAPEPDCAGESTA